MARKPSSKQKESKPAEDIVSRVVGDFDRSWEYTQSNYHKRWQDAWKLYNNQRTDKRSYRGITNTFVPMTFSTIETMVSALFGAKPRFNYIAPADNADQNTEILNSLLDFYWDKDKWNIKVINWGRGMLREGTSVIYIYWNIDHPCIINVPIRDFFIDPNATNLENARYMGRRFLTSKDELEGMEIVDTSKVDENGEPSGEMKKKYQNLDKIVRGSTGENTDKEEKDLFYGSTTPDDESQIECIEWWTKDRVVTIANRSVVIEDTENPHKVAGVEAGDEYAEGLIPFADLRDYIDESLYYARGEVEVIADQQELLNDLTNQRNDAIAFTLNQMYTLDPKYAHLLEEIENLPGAVYLAAKDALTPIAQRPVPAEAFNESLNIKNEIRETTASNEVVKGVGQDKKTTATEVNAQIAGAGQRLGLKITQIENDGFHRLAKIVFEMIKRYVTEPMMVRIVGKDGIHWEQFDPAQFRGEYEPRVQLQTSIENQKQEDAEMAKEMMAAFLGDMDVNQLELKKIVLAKGFKLDPDEVEILITPPEVPEEMLDEGIDPLDPTLDPTMQELPEELPEMLPEELGGLA